MREGGRFRFEQDGQRRKQAIEKQTVFRKNGMGGVEIPDGDGCTVGVADRADHARYSGQIAFAITGNVTRPVFDLGGDERLIHYHRVEAHAGTADILIADQVYAGTDRRAGRGV